MADFVLSVHALIVLFNVGGLLMILIGGPLRWTWARHRGFRTTHIALMGFVAAEAFLGITCPLTWLEDELRGVATGQSFVQRWVSALIYWNAPPWVFAVLYAMFLMTVIAAWLLWPPTISAKHSLRG